MHADCARWKWGNTRISKVNKVSQSHIHTLQSLTFTLRQVKNHPDCGDWSTKWLFYRLNDHLSYLSNRQLQNTSSEPLTPLSLSASTGHLCLCFNVFSLFLPASATGYESCSDEMLDEQYLNFSLFVFQVVLKNAKTLRLCVSWLDSFYLKGNSRLKHKKYDYKQKLRCSNCNISFPRTGTSSSSLLCCDWQVLIAVNHPFNCQKAFLTWKKLVLIYNTAIFTTMIWKKKKSLACISQYCEK